MWPFKKKPFVRPSPTVTSHDHTVIEGELPWHLVPNAPRDADVRKLRVTLDTDDSYAEIFVMHPSGWYYNSSTIKVPKDVLGHLGKLCTDVAFENESREYARALTKARTNG